MSKNVEVPTMAATFLPRRSSTRVSPASLRATMAPSTAVATPVTFRGTPSSNTLAARAKLMSMASTFLAVNWLMSPGGAPGTAWYSAVQPRFPSRSSLWMISVAAQPSCRWARRTLPLACARRIAGAPIQAAAAAPAPALRNARRPIFIADLLSPHRRHLGQVLQGFLDLVRRVFVVLELPAPVGLLAADVEVAVAAQVEDDGAPLPLALAAQGLVHGAAHRMGRLGGWQDPLGGGELHGDLESG